MALFGFLLYHEWNKEKPIQSMVDVLSVTAKSKPVDELRVESPTKTKEICCGCLN